MERFYDDIKSERNLLRIENEELKNKIKESEEANKNKMEQGIKMLEEMGYVKQSQNLEQIEFKKQRPIKIDYDAKWIYINNKKGVVKLDIDDIGEWLTLEEAKACIMIMEAMKKDE